MKTQRPLVSICIPVHNAEDTIRRMLSSVLRQSWKELEIIVVDNASTDRTLDQIKPLLDSRVRVYQNERDIGGERNFTRAVNLASGEYVAVFHADDVYAPAIVEREMLVFEQHPEVGAVFALADYINASGRTIRRGRLPRPLCRRLTYEFPQLMTSILEHGNFLVFPSAMVRAGLYKTQLPFRAEQFATSADLDMWLRIAHQKPIAVVNEVLMSYRISKQQGSYTTRYLRTEPADFFEVIDYHLKESRGELLLSDRSLASYEFMRAIDDTRRGVNHLIIGNRTEARRILKSKGRPATVFAGARQPRLLPYYLGGKTLGSMSWMPWIGSLLRWYMYTWKRRRYQ